MPKKADSKYDNGPTFVLNDPDHFVVLGFSADLGSCNAKTQQGNKCQNFVNLQVSQLCAQHMLAQFNKAASKRGEFR
jgi:hypothetical protein